MKNSAVQKLSIIIILYIYFLYIIILAIEKAHMRAVLFQEGTSVAGANASYRQITEGQSRYVLLQQY